MHDSSRQMQHRSMENGSTFCNSKNSRQNRLSANFIGPPCRLRGRGAAARIKAEYRQALGRASSAMNFSSSSYISCAKRQFRRPPLVYLGGT